MCADFNDIVKQGYMQMKGKKLGVWQKKWIILRKKSSRGPNRLEKFSDEKTSELSVECKRIDLDYVRAIRRLSSSQKPHSLTVILKDNSAKYFACDSEHDIDDWYEALINHVTTAPGKDTLDWEHSVHVKRDTFNVFLLPASSLNFYGECLLKVSSDEILLQDVDDPDETKVKWGLTTLRKYGRDKSKFTFQSGRSSQTGEGLFICNTMEGEQIYQKVHNATLALVEVGRAIRREDSCPQLANMGTMPGTRTADSDTLGKQFRANGLTHANSVPVKGTGRPPVPLPTSVSVDLSNPPKPPARRRPPPPPGSSPVDLPPPLPTGPRGPPLSQASVDEPPLTTGPRGPTLNQYSVDVPPLPTGPRGPPLSQASVDVPPLPTGPRGPPLNQYSVDEPPPVPSTPRGPPLNNNTITHTPAAQQNGAAAGTGVDGVVYEEKYLTEEFRKFLAERKSEENP